MEFPTELRYTKEHEWVRVEADGKTAVIGITEFAQRELGDIVYVDLHDEGAELDAHGVFGTVEAVKTVSDLYMPVAGTIVGRNEALDGRPELVNEDPYGEGWMIRITLSNPADVDGLLTADAYGDTVG